MNTQNAPELITPIQAARRLHVCRKTLARLEINSYRVSERKTLYSATDIEQYLRDNYLRNNTP